MLQILTINKVMNVGKLFSMPELINLTGLTRGELDYLRKNDILNPVLDLPMRFSYGQVYIAKLSKVIKEKISNKKVIDLLKTIIFNTKHVSNFWDSKFLLFSFLDSRNGIYLCQYESFLEYEIEHIKLFKTQNSNIIKLENYYLKPLKDNDFYMFFTEVFIVDMLKIKYELDEYGIKNIESYKSKINDYVYQDDLLIGV